MEREKTLPALSSVAAAWAPLAPAIILSLATAVVSWPELPPISTINTFVYAALFSYVIFALLGLPTLFYLQRHGRLSFPWLVLGGALAGCIGGALILGLLALASGGVGSRWHDFLEFGSLAGLSVSMSYWAIQRVV